MWPRLLPVCPCVRVDKAISVSCLPASFSRFACLLLLGLLLLLSRPASARANPQVPQGSSASFAASGTSGPATGTWDILLPGQMTPGPTNASPGGWTVSYNPMSGTPFTVGAPASATIATGYTVRYNGGMVGVHSAIFDVVGPPTVSSVSLAPIVVPGGVSSTGTVTLTAAAPSGGMIVTLASDTTSVATVPATLSFTAGQTSKNFTVTTFQTATAKSVKISASYSGTTVFQYLTVNPPRMASFTVSPSSLIGGGTVTATVTLDSPAMSGGVSVTIDCLDPSYRNAVAKQGTNGSFTPLPASFTITQGSTSGQMTLITSTVNYPTFLYLSATTSLDSQNDDLTLNPTNLRVTDIFMPKTIRLEWNNAITSGHTFTITRTNGSSTTTVVNNLSSSTRLYDDAFNFTTGATYLYQLYDSSDLVNRLSADQVIPYQVNASANQAVDSRLDLRQGGNVYLDHQFGSTYYRGGLFAGLASDNSVVGRSFARFGLTGPPANSIFRMGNVNAYFTGAATSGTTSVSVNVGCQILADTGWDATTLHWTNAPSVTPGNATSTATVTYNPSSPNPKWTYWPLAQDIRSVLFSVGAGAPVNMTAAWTAANETTQGWAYFAKTEYDNTLAPCAMYVLCNPTLITASCSPATIHSGQTSVCTITLNGIGPTDQATVNLSYSPQASLYITSGSMPSTLTVSGLGRSFVLTANTMLMNSGTVTITVQYGGASTTAVLSVLP